MAQLKCKRSFTEFTIDKIKNFTIRARILFIKRWM